MATTPDHPTTAAPASAVGLPAAFLALRERSRSLLRERCDELHALESRLQGQLDQLLADLHRIQTQAPTSDPVDSDRIASLEAEIRRLQRLRGESEQALDEARVMLAEMEEERRALRERLDSDDSRQQPQAPNKDQAEQVERLQRRLEMAMQEIRELKEQNAELASKPASTSTAPRMPAAEDLQSFDWETQKQRLLQQLETDFDTHQPQQAKEKLRIEEVIRTTDRIVAEKDEEIASLRLQLSDRVTASDNEESAAVSRLVDTDEAIKAERERLGQLQEEWRGKLRKAEVEISIERAKLARERLQLEEKLRTLESQVPAPAEDNSKSDDSKGGGPPAGAPRGKWLTRLGLGGSE